jgi:hypothetical protein
MNKQEMKEIEEGIYTEILTALEELTEAERGESEMTDAHLPHAVLEVAAHSATYSVMAYIRGTEAIRSTKTFVSQP